MMDSVEPLTLQGVFMMAVAFLCFVALLGLGSKFLPGRIEKGVVALDGSQTSYKLNGLLLLLAVMAVVATASVAGFPLSTLPRNALAGFCVANVFALSLSVLLYAFGRTLATDSKTSSNPSGFWRGLYYGVERNPTWFGLDLKFFSYRPSLIGLGLFNVSFAFWQYERHGFLTAEMTAYQLLTFGYIANYFQFEYGMIFTWDIIEERFGGMLVWGDYVYVPFFYSLPGWYLVDRLTPLPTGALAGIVALYLAGFWLFRGANEQKHAFRRNPNTTIWGKPPRVVGGRLLASGFWGVGRKLNYTGELMMYCAWTLLCGFVSWVPYLLPLSLATLFVHRAFRDDRRCRAKYGSVWDEYCEIARFRMIPFLY
jgi:Delta14-sterol reductase